MKIDLTPLGHAAAAVLIQCSIGLAFSQWAFGGALGCMWFIAREQTQAEYRWIAKLGSGKRENMPWWGGFDYRAWDAGSVLDFAVPVVAVTAVWLIAQ